MWTPIGDKAAFAPFEQQLNDDQDVVLNIVEKDPATYEEDLVNAIASGTGPDIYYMRNDWVAKYHGLAKPIPFQTSKYSNTVKDYQKMYPQAVVNEMVDAKKNIYGYPMSADPLVMFINGDLFSTLRAQLIQSSNGIDDATDEAAKKLSIHLG